MKMYVTGLADMQRASATIDDNLEQFIERWLQSFDAGSIAAIEAYCEIVVRGGKRLRGILAMQSYYAHGGTDYTVAVGSARVLELVQAYLLVLDDIADRSDTRRGGPAAHRLVEQAARQDRMLGDLVHYSEAQVINAAQCGLHKAAQELLELPVSDLAARRALASLHKNIEVTGIGQMNDMYNESTNELLDEIAVERVLTQKSAYYTFVNPLELGACLAGAQLSEPLRTYGLHTGCAFQIADDLIGTFGLESETGKNANDDIREGKMTLIAQYALAHAAERDRARLRILLGKAEATDAECNEVRAIMMQSGARRYAQERRDWYAEQAAKVLATDTSTDPDFIAFLGRLVHFATTRKS
jgi:geranylgeranyl diphosphate synthase type I